MLLRKNVHLHAAHDVINGKSGYIAYIAGRLNRLACISIVFKIPGFTLLPFMKQETILFRRLTKLCGEMRFFKQWILNNVVQSYVRLMLIWFVFCQRIYFQIDNQHMNPTTDFQSH